MAFIAGLVIGVGIGVVATVVFVSLAASFAVARGLGW